MSQSAPHAQETRTESPPPAPVVLEPLWGKPKIEILEAENEENRRFEKWREKVLVVLGHVPPSATKRDVVTQPLPRSTFTVQLQANEKKSDLDKRFAQLKAELNTVQSAEPQLKKWDSSRWTSKGEMTFPAYSSSSIGWVSYVWLIRDFEMEGVRAGKKTMFKAQVTTQEESALTGFGGDCRFDFETGEVIHLNHEKGAEAGH